MEANCVKYSAEGPTKIQEGQFADSESKGYTPKYFRFTVKGSSLYAFVLKYSDDGNVTITHLAKADASHLPLFHGIIKNISALGYDEEPMYCRDETGLHIHMDNVKSKYPVVFKIELY